MERSLLRALSLFFARFARRVVGQEPQPRAPFLLAALAAAFIVPSPASIIATDNVASFTNFHVKGLTFNVGVTRDGQAWR